jgi:hypothetical protein
METTSRLQQAQQRLESALNRLDTAIQDRLAQGVSSDDLQALQKELEESRANEERLQDVTETVAGKLDAAIERLQRVIKP